MIKELNLNSATKRTKRGFKKRCIDLRNRISNTIKVIRANGNVDDTLLGRTLTADGGCWGYTAIMYTLIVNEKLKKVVEIGVDKGQSTRVLLTAAKKINGGVFSFDIVQKDKKIVGDLAQWWDFTCMDSKEAGLHWKGEIDLLFIDGDHSFEGAYGDLEVWYPHIRKGGVIVMHDMAEGTTSRLAYEKFFWDKDDDRFIFGFPLETAVVRKK